MHIEPFIKAEALLDSDFYFDYARLTVVGTLAPVPIPGAFWLLGSGILGLAGISRRKK